MLNIFLMTFQIEEWRIRHKKFLNFDEYLNSDAQKKYSYLLKHIKERLLNNKFCFVLEHSDLKIENVIVLPKKMAGTRFNRLDIYSEDRVAFF